MNELAKLATIEFARFLESNLPTISVDWWSKNVIDRLSFQQQRTAQEKKFTSLRQFDLAGLLRVFDQNWFELTSQLNLPREARNWLRELQTIRNKWAHHSSEESPPSETYRDADTLTRLLEMIGAERSAIDAVNLVKSNALILVSQNAQSSVAPSTPATTISPEPTPATSHLFREGQLVALRSNPSIYMPVLEVLKGGAECRYRVFQNSAVTTYYESQLQAIAGGNSEPAIITKDELHACLTSLQILSPSTANLFSLRSGRVQFVPYQYRPVLKLIKSDRPRLLIADEVGVGKTIETGLIIKELRARMQISSVLVICPKALISERKWFNEMKRFDEHFTALDGSLLRHCLQETHIDGEWPEQYNRALLPFSLFDSDLLIGKQGASKAKNQSLLALDPPPKFDLVIVDEAHHLRNPETFLHQGVRHFCDNAQAVVLLSATPVQLGSDDLFTLLNVLRPDLVIDKASFAQMSEPNAHINQAVQYCRAADIDWQQHALACLDDVANTEWGRLFIRENSSFQAVYDQLKELIISDADRIATVRAIEDLYTFSSLINRTRRRDIGEFTTRKPETISIEFTPSQQLLHDGVLDVVAKILTRCHGSQNVKFMMTTIRRQAASCLYGLAPTLSDVLSGNLNRLEQMEINDNDDELDFSFVDVVRAEINALLEQAKNLDAYDPKVAAFVQVLKYKSRRTNNKSLVFSTFRHTLTYLDQHTQAAGLRSALIHGDVPDHERAELRRRFSLNKDDPNAIDVLISSEVGCEGLDFQFCDLLVNYDLPWNPMRIEQRIGRIDRYGQKSETVAIVNFITPGTVDADIYERCLWRIGIFQHTIGGNEEILGKVTQQLHDITENFDLSSDERAKRLQQLSDNGIRQIREEQDLESKQSELFGLNVPGQSWRDEVAAAETFWLSPNAIERTVVTYLDKKLGSATEHLLGDKPLKTLRLNQEARTALLNDYKQLPRTFESMPREWGKWLKGSQPNLSVTFEQSTAVEHPSAVHLSVLHPLVRQAARALEVREPQHYKCTIHSNELEVGDHHFAIYRWEKHGIKADEALVPIANNSELECKLLELLQSATTTDHSSLPSTAECDALDSRHYHRWSSAQANHIADNRQLVEHRIQSLTASHRARCKAIEEQIARANNDKIRLMKTSELARANHDFNSRMSEFQQLANSGDIRATPVVFGTLTISKES
jgi:ATP-dependent helicase HepA